jgi:hypothetical protein
MTLENMVIKNLSEWRPAARDTLLVTAASSPWTVAVTADHCELLSARLWELAVRRSSAGTGSLATWANSIAERMAGLLEPLRVVEVDELTQKAMLRSQTPAGRNGKATYYEVLIEGTQSATLRRYQANDDAAPRREQIAFVLTHEVIAGVIAALTAQP